MAFSWRCSKVSFGTSFVSISVMFFLDPLVVKNARRKCAGSTLPPMVCVERKSTHIYYKLTRVSVAINRIPVAGAVPACHIFLPP
jgi:hypothetical protein